MDYRHWADRTRVIYNQMRQAETPYLAQVAGVEIEVYPSVFAPEQASGKVFAEIVPQLVSSRSLLEIGTGTGIIALLCALNGASPMVATDISHRACENAKANAKRHQVPMDVRHGCLFEPIRPEEQFGVIFWNHPFNWSDQPVGDELDRAGFDYNYEGVRGYLAGARHHLTPGGVVLLGTGSFARLDIIESCAVHCGYEFEIIWRKQAPLGETGEEIEFLIYRFTI